MYVVLFLLLKYNKQDQQHLPPREDITDVNDKDFWMNRYFPKKTDPRSIEQLHSKLDTHVSLLISVVTVSSADVWINFSQSFTRGAIMTRKAARFDRGCSNSSLLGLGTDVFFPSPSELIQ